MLVPITEVTMAQLLPLRTDADETLDSVIARLARGCSTPVETVAPNPKPAPPCAEHQFPAATGRGKHSAEVLGERIKAPALGKLFAAVIDMVAGIDSAIIERLSQTKARKRPYVARSRLEVHPGRPDLRTVRSRSGWWVSANVSREDVQRGLKALCKAASLNFGSDVLFPAK